MISVSLANATFDGPAVGRFFQGLGEQAAVFLPRLAFVLAITVIGLLTAWLTARFVRWAVRASGLETLAEKVGLSQLLYHVGTKEPVSHWAGRLVYWTLVLVTASAVADYLEIEILSQGLASFVAFLPRLLAGGFILGAGVLIARTAQGVVAGVGEDGRTETSQQVGRVAFYLVLSVAIAMALQQIGVQTELLTLLIAVVVGAFVLAVAAAFAIGAAPAMRHFVARQQLERVLRPGDVVTLDGERLVVVRYATTSIVLQGEDRRVLLVPGHNLLDRVTEVELALPRREVDRA